MVPKFLKRNGANSSRGGDHRVPESRKTGMECKICGQPGRRIAKAEGKIVHCCDDPYCQEQVDDYIDNVPKEEHKPPLLGGGDENVLS